ncbi:MAG: twin-arginine translocase TatA/TatE family subunit [Acidimicrobiales bacterium]|jgi:Sec-independent protein translocase protein TatA
MFVGEIFGPDLLVVVIAGAVLLFGGAAIPKFARNLGKSKSEFEQGLKSVKELAEPTAAPDVSPSSREVETKH